jgi:hypothetical protein
MYCCYFSAFFLVLPIHFQPPLSISHDDTHHTMIGTFPLCASVFSNIQNSIDFILDRASILYASLSRPTLMDALDQACSEYKSSDTHNVVKKQFLLCSKKILFCNSQNLHLVIISNSCSLLSAIHPFFPIYMGCLYV